MPGPGDVSALVLAVGRRAVRWDVSALRVANALPLGKTGDGTTACGRTAQAVGLGAAGRTWMAPPFSRGPSKAVRARPGQSLRAWAAAHVGAAAARLSLELWAAPGFLPRDGGGRAPLPSLRGGA